MKNSYLFSGTESTLGTIETEGIRMIIGNTLETQGNILEIREIIREIQGNQLEIIIHEILENTAENIVVEISR